MEETILRDEVLRLIDSGDPFDLVFITADRRRGTGGSIKRVENWLKIKGEAAEANLPGVFKQVKDPVTRNPYHLQNKTFNIYNPANPGDHPIKVHWRLMIFFNQKRILQ
jgi:hypothetical protein